MELIKLIKSIFIQSKCDSICTSFVKAPESSTSTKKRPYLTSKQHNEDRGVLGGVLGKYGKL